MSKRHTEVRVATRPGCDLCGDGTPAEYDAKTVHGSWGFLCQEHFKTVGVGLGLGLGQRLIVEVPNAGE